MVMAKKVMEDNSENAKFVSFKQPDGSIKAPSGEGEFHKWATASEWQYATSIVQCSLGFFFQYKDLSSIKVGKLLVGHDDCEKGVVNVSFIGLGKRKR